MSTVRDRERGRQAGVCSVSEMKWTPIHFASMLMPESFVNSEDKHFVQEMLVRNAKIREEWVRQEMCEGHDVLEYVIDKGVLRMRPLRPDDV